MNKLKIINFRVEEEKRKQFHEKAKKRKIHLSKLIIQLLDELK